MDVYTGALSEPPMEGSVVGPLLSCILSDQFLRLKRGDSHWYERKVGPQQFTKGIVFCFVLFIEVIKLIKRPITRSTFNLIVDQLTQLYGTTLAGIICRNSDGLNTVQRYVMKRIEGDNPMISCSEIDTFSFDPWTEVPYRRDYVSVQTGSQAAFIRTMTNNAS